MRNIYYQFVHQTTDTFLKVSKLVFLQTSHFTEQFIHFITSLRYGCEVLWWVGYICLSVGLFVCLRVCLSAGITWKPRGRTSPIFCARWLWAWLVSPLMALRHVMHFRFYKWRRVFIPRAESWKTLCLKEVCQMTVSYQLDVRHRQCLVEFVRMQHRDEVCYLRLSCFGIWDDVATDWRIHGGGRVARPITSLYRVTWCWHWQPRLVLRTNLGSRRSFRNSRICISLPTVCCTVQNVLSNLLHRRPQRGISYSPVSVCLSVCLYACKPISYLNCCTDRAGFWWRGFLSPVLLLCHALKKFDYLQT